MPKVKKSYIFVFFLLLLIGMLCFFALRNKQKDVPAQHRRSELGKVPHDNKVFFWDIYPELIIPNSGKNLSAAIKVHDLNGKELQLQDISPSFPVLVFRYSQYDCHLCVDQVLEKMGRVFEGDENKVWLIVDGMTARDFRIKYKERDIRFQTYLIVEGNLGLTLENKNMPFLFTLEPASFQVNKIFVPFKEFPDQTDTYLNKIKELFNE